MTIGTFEPASGGFQFMRILGDQVHIEGPRRLSDIVLLDFQEGLLSDAPAGSALFAPSSSVQVTIFAPGPFENQLSQETAATYAEMVAAICAFATGRSVTYQPPLFSVSDEAAALARSRRADPSILGLARDSISLDIFGDLIAIGGAATTPRVRGSLLAYHAALKQSAPDVAVMLLVTSIEALLSPVGEWGKDKVTRRSIDSMIEWCPDAVDALVDHPNVEEAFGYERRGQRRRQRRDLLDRIYQSRSLPTHTGLSFSPWGQGMFSHTGGMRVALLSDLARAEVLAYLRAPRSSVIGYPSLVSGDTSS